MKDKRKFERHERMYGPHFTEECAMKVVAKMENEDGTTGQHWTINDTTTVANQYGISFNPRKYNKYDWYVAMNMVYSDYYKFITNTLHSISMLCAIYIVMTKRMMKNIIMNMNILQDKDIL